MNNNDIIKQLDTLKEITPSQEWRKEALGVILTQTSQYREEKKSASIITFFNTVRAFMHEMPFQIAPLAVLLLFFVVGGGVMFTAAHKSLPGNFLYPIKLNIEKAKLALSSSSSEKTELNIEFAQNRVNELGQIMQFSQNNEENVKKVNIVAHTLRASIESVKENVKKNEKQRDVNFKIALSLASTTNDLMQAIKNSEDNLSEEVKITLKEAVDSAEEAGIEALIKSIEPIDTTHSSTSDSIIENSYEAIGLLKDKIAKISDEVDALMKEYNDLVKDNVEITKEDNVTIEDIESLIQKFIEESELALEKENYTKISENIGLMKDLMHKISGIINKYSKTEAQILPENSNIVEIEEDAVSTISEQK